MLPVNQRVCIRMLHTEHEISGNFSNEFKFLVTSFNFYRIHKIKFPFVEVQFEEGTVSAVKIMEFEIEDGIRLGGLFNVSLDRCDV